VADGADALRSPCADDAVGDRLRSRQRRIEPSKNIAWFLAYDRLPRRAPGCAAGGLVAMLYGSRQTLPEYLRTRTRSSRPSRSTIGGDPRVDADPAR
jgi:hypothetical protein